MIKSAKKPVKILGNGKVNHPLVVKAHRFSAVAKKKIEMVGGETEEMGNASESS
jgi:large subunit ribosomal protein L15